MISWKRLRQPTQLCALSDEALCRELTKGNQDAFLALFDRYSLDVFRLANSVLQNKTEAEDLVQGLFLEVHRTMLRYDEQRGAFRTVLFRYAYTRAIDHRRQLESRRFYATMHLEELDPETMTRDQSDFQGLTVDERLRFIEEGLQCLDEKKRVVVTAYFFEGLSLNEIAERLDESHGNVRHHLYRGLEHMRKALMSKEVLISDEAEANELREKERAISLSSHGRVGKRIAPEVSGA